MDMDIELPGAGGTTVWSERDHVLSESAAEQIVESWSANTRRARKHDWDRFVRWCEKEGRTPLPATPQTVANYVAHLTKQVTQKGTPPSPATIERVLSSIGGVHTMQQKSVSMRLATKVLKTYREKREREGFRVKRADVITVDQMASMGRAAGDTVIGTRDRMIVFLAYKLLARRSEMRGILISDLTFTSDGGMDVRLVRKKTDKKSKGQVIHIRPDLPQVCAVAATRAWLELMRSQQITDGFLVRQVTAAGRVRGQISDKLVDRVVKKLAAAAGLDAAVSGHTLRRSPATEMAEKGVPESRMARRGGWSERSRSVQGYVEEARDRFDDPLSSLTDER